MQPTSCHSMSSSSSPFPHSTPPTRASCPPSSSASHQQPNCISSYSPPDQSPSPETTMVDFDLLLPTSPPPHRLYPYRPFLTEHGHTTVDSLGSFNSVLQKSTLGPYAHVTQRQPQSRAGVQVQLQGTQSQVQQVSLSRKKPKVVQDTPAPAWPSAAKPPTAPKEGVARGSDQVAKTRAEIRRARAARNRSSARRSRLKKKAESQRDMEKASLIQRQNETLKRRVAELREKVLSLQKITNALGLSDTQNGSADGDEDPDMELPEIER